MDERDDFKLLKQRLHRKVLDRLDLATLAKRRSTRTGTELHS